MGFDPPAWVGQKHKNRDSPRTRWAIVLSFWIIVQVCIWNGITPLPRCCTHFPCFRRCEHISIPLWSLCLVGLFPCSVTLFTRLGYLLEWVNTLRTIFIGLYVLVHICLPPGSRFTSGPPRLLPSCANGSGILTFIHLLGIKFIIMCFKWVLQVLFAFFTKSLSLSPAISPAFQG